MKKPYEAILLEVFMMPEDSDIICTSAGDYWVDGDDHGGSDLY